MQTKTKNNLLWQVPFLLFLTIGSIWILRQHQQPKYLSEMGPVFGTTYHISYRHDTSLKPLIEARLQEVNMCFSTFDPESEISRINRNDSLRISPMFETLFSLAQQVSDITHGAFDISVAPLVNAWGFGFERADRIAPDYIDSLRLYVGYQHISLRQGRIHKVHPETMLDCSAIAKGYGSDAVAHLLDSLHVEDYMIEIGGEIVVKGSNTKGKPWRIGINKPVEDSTGTNNEVKTMLDLTNRALATSGNYRRFYIKNGRKYAHTINPKTGYPVEHSLLSATVIAPSCALADAYATAFMVMGLKPAQMLLEQHPELMAYFIYHDASGQMRTWTSPALSQYMVP